MSTSNVILEYDVVWSNNIQGTITAMAKYNPPVLDGNTSPFVFIGNASGQLYRFFDGSDNLNSSVFIELTPSLNTPITGLAFSTDGNYLFVNACGGCYRYSADQVIATTSATLDLQIYSGTDNNGGVAVDTEEFVYMVAENGNAIYFFDDYGSTGISTVLYRYPVAGVLQLKDLEFNKTESKLYTADRFSGNIYYYDFENDTGTLQVQVVVGSNSLAQALSFDDAGNLFYSHLLSNYVNMYSFTNNLYSKIAGGSSPTSLDPLQRELYSPRILLSVSGGLYISSDVSGGIGSDLFKIDFQFVERYAPVVPAPQFKRVNCGIAAPGNCKRAIVPFNPREYWSWGSPNRPFLTPDPNVSCRPSIVFQLCPTIPPVVQPIPPVPPIPQPEIPPARTEIPTTQWNTRRAGQAKAIGNLTDICETSLVGQFRTAPALGPLSEVYAVNSLGVLYKVNPTTTLYNIGKSVIRASPTVANNGAIYVADDLGGLYRFNSNGNLLWQKQTGAQVFGSPGTFTTSTEDNVFFASGNVLYNYQGRTGDVLWSNVIGGGDTFRSSPYIGALIVIGSDKGSVYAYQRTSGAISWKYPLGSSNLGQPVISTPHLIGNNYMFGAGSNLYALTTNGLLEWSYTVSGIIISSPAVYRDNSSRIWSFFTTNCNVMYGIRKNTTSFTVWKSVEAVDSNCSPMLDACDTPFVYGYNSNGQVYKYLAEYTTGSTQSAVATFTASGTIDCKSLVNTRQNYIYVLTLNNSAYRVQ